MTRLLVSLFAFSLTLAAQPVPTPSTNVAPALAAGVLAVDPVDPPAPAKPGETQSTPAAPAPASPAATSPAPTGETVLTGSFDVGYRWNTGVAGSYDTYRSMVNLGSGPKLIGADFTLLDPRHRAFDEMHVRAYGWGDEPYGTFHLDAKKSKWYVFNADYRDMAFFNYLPSYADPLASRGITLDEQAFDTRRHLGSYSLDLLPGNWLTPYLSFERDSGSGIGTSVFVSSGDEFPVPATLRDITNLYRGGLRIERKKFHVTLEAGGTTFQDAESLYQAGSTTNYGNSNAPLLGQTLDLQNLEAAYGVRGTSEFVRGLLTANVTSWLDLYGQFQFSQPHSTVNYSQFDTGSLSLQTPLLFYASQEYLVSAAAKLPHTTGNLGAEIRPFRRVRIMQSFLTDRLHQASSDQSANTLYPASAPASQAAATELTALLASSLASNYNQEELNVYFDATSKLQFRAGYRYVWGDAWDATLPAEGLASSDHTFMHRNVALGGITYRPSSKLRLSAESESAQSSGAYFRTSLYNYEKVRAQGRYQVTGSFTLSADFSALNNQDPQPGVNYNYQFLQESASLLWAPGKKIFDFQGSYTRSALRSDLGILDPGTLTPQVSDYRENAHTATALVNVRLAHVSARTPRLMFGGSMFRSSGSRPTAYYQPKAELWVPLTKHATWFTQWTYYGYGEIFYLYEGFRVHLATTGLRITL